MIFRVFLERSQGVSRAGRQQGVSDERTFLVAHVFRLLDSTRAPMA